MSVTSTGVFEVLPFKLSLETLPPPPPPPPPESLLGGYCEEDNFNLLNSILANIYLLFFIQVVNCGDPGTPPNGVRYGDVFTYLSQVILECDPQYRLVGNLFRTCQADGTWSGSQPTCQGKNTKGAQQTVKQKITAQGINRRYKTITNKARMSKLKRIPTVTFENLIVY